MLLHYLGKVNSSNLLQITTEEIKKCVVFDKNETFMLSYGWLEIGVLFSQHTLEVSTVRLHACTKMLVPLVNALSMMLWSTLCHTCCTLFQFVSVVQPRLVHSLLDDAPDPVINRIKVRAVCWPKIRWNERRRCSRSRTVSGSSVLGHCPVERRKKFPGYLAHHGE